MPRTYQKQYTALLITIPPGMDAKLLKDFLSFEVVQHWLASQGRYRDKQRYTEHLDTSLEKEAHKAGMCITIVKTHEEASCQ